MIPANWQSARASGQIGKSMVNIRQEQSGIDKASSCCFKQSTRNLGVLRFVSLADRIMAPRASEENQPIMKLQSRIVASIAAITLLVVPRIVSAQSALATADAAAFLGAWSITVESPQGPFEQTLELKDSGGKVAGTLTSAISPDPTAISDIAKDGEDLVLKFSGDFQGNAFTAKLTLAPQGTDKAKVTFDIMDGQFVMDGTGVKK